MSILDDYGAPIAQPKVYNWKEELKKKRMTIARNIRLEKLPQQNAELDKFGNLVVGEGLEQEIF